jgi:branched-chain amino acid transport system permease protein
MLRAARLLLLAFACAFLVDAGGGQARAEESAGGVLRLATDEGPRFVANALIRVRAEGGAVVGEARSDQRGAWRIQVPAQGRYVVSLDLGTLPEDLGLRGGARAELTIEVGHGEDAIVLFPLALREAVERRDPNYLSGRILQSLADGLVFGAVLAIAAAGLSLVYGLTGIVNFAHGDVVSLAALFAAVVNAAAGGPQANLFLAGALAVALISLIGWPLEGLFRAVGSRASDHFTILVFAIGLSFLVRHALLFVFGPFSLAYRQYQLQEPFRLGPVLMAPRDLAVGAIALAIMVAFGVFMTRTRPGWAMRATASNPGLAEQSGIDVRRMRRWAWVLGSALAAAGGVLLAVSQQARWDIGYQLLMFMFAAVILGGIGTAFGALLGGFVIGLVAQTSTLVIPPELKPAVAMMMLVAVLLVRPAGLLNRARRVG